MPREVTLCVCGHSRSAHGPGGKAYHKCLRYMCDCAQYTFSHTVPESEYKRALYGAQAASRAAKYWKGP